MIEQAKHEELAVEFIEGEATESLEAQWEQRIRTRVRGADGLIGLISSSTAEDDVQLWTIQCAGDEKKPVLLMYVDEHGPDVPEALRGKHINEWSWANLRTFVESLWFQAGQR